MAAVQAGFDPGNKALLNACAYVSFAHHIPDAARQDAFGEMYRVLRPGGALLAADFWRAPPDSASRPAVTSCCCVISGPSTPGAS